jgi:hypothetical protein
MKIALLETDGLLQAYAQITSSEAERIIAFLQSQINQESPPASHSERAGYEDFTKNRLKPETAKGLFTIAIVEL